MMRKFGLLGSLLALGVGQGLAQTAAPGVADFNFCGARRVGAAAFSQTLVSADENNLKTLHPGYFLRIYLGLKPNKNECRQLLIN